MAAPVEGLPRVVPVAAARDLLRASRHHGFPVYDPLHRDSRVSRKSEGGRRGSHALQARQEAHGPGWPVADRPHMLRPPAPRSARPPPTRQGLQLGSFRADGFIVRSQLEMLLAAPEAYCDAVSARQGGGLAGVCLCCGLSVRRFLPAWLPWRVWLACVEGSLGLLGPTAGRDLPEVIQPAVLTAQHSMHPWRAHPHPHPPALPARTIPACPARHRRI